MTQDMTAVIRIAIDSDIDNLHRFYEAVGHKQKGYFEQCLQEQAEGKRLFYLSESILPDQEDSGLQITGFCMLVWTPQYAVYQKLGIPELQDLNVHPDARRQGIAHRLIKQCEDKAIERALPQIGISVGLTKSYGPAQRLYVSLGYSPDGMGVTYERDPVNHGEIYPIDDNLCLMMIKELI